MVPNGEKGNKLSLQMPNKDAFGPNDASIIVKALVLCTILMLLVVAVQPPGGRNE
jgi:hypothetical protein